METPNSDRLRPRLSSSIKKPRKSLDNSASKLVKTLVNKEKLRKLNQYKSAKSKRAELLVKNRHISENDEEKIEIDEPGKEKENVSCNRRIFSTITEEENMMVKTEPLSEIKESVIINQQKGITSKISTSIMIRINSFKRSIKNIVNINPKTNILKVEPSSPKKSSMRRSISMSGIPNQTKSDAKCLKKQESSSSIQNSNLLSAKNSSINNRIINQNTTISKPVFKVPTKIQYNDSHLYREVEKSLYLKF